MPARLARWIDTMISVALSAGAVPGCSAPATYSYNGPPLARSNVAQVSAGMAGEVVALPRLVSVDGRPAIARSNAVEVAPGRRELDVEVTWSNRFVDRTRIAFQAHGGHQYAVIAREAPHPAAVVGEGLYEATGRTVLGVFLVPFEVGKYFASKKPPKLPHGRPPRQCSVSIVDMTTGKPAPVDTRDDDYGVAGLAEGPAGTAGGSPRGSPR